MTGPAVVLPSQATSEPDEVGLGCYWCGIAPAPNEINGGGRLCDDCLARELDDDV